MGAQRNSSEFATTRLVGTVFIDAATETRDAPTGS
jgi:hypothetical protein